jgi:hypothetical protein
LLEEERQTQEEERQRQEVERLRREEERRRQEERQRQEEERQRQEVERLRREEERRRQEESRRQEEERQRRKEEERKRLEAVRRREQELLERQRVEREALQRKIEEIKHREEQKREAEAKVARQLVIQGSNLVTFGPGLEVKRVIPGFDLCTITIRELPLHATRPEITNLFHEQGMDDTMFQFVSCKTEGNTQVAKFLLRAEEARVIAVGLEDLEFHDNFIKLEVGENASWGSMAVSSRTDEANTLTVIWAIPSATIIATYNTVGEAQLKAKEFHGKTINGRKINATMNTRANGRGVRNRVGTSVRLTNLDPDREPVEISTLAGTPSVQVIMTSIYDLKWFLSWLKATLEKEGCIAGSFGTMKINDDRMKAVAKFTSRDTLKGAAATLERGTHITVTRKGPTLRVIVPSEHRYTINIPQLQYRAQKAQWNAIAEGRRGGRAFVKVNERKSGQILINVEGSDQQEIGLLKVRVEGLVAGERLDAEHWHDSFLHSEKALCERVLAETGAFLCVDRRLHALRVCGGSNEVAAAKNCVRDEVQRLALMEYEIPIARQSVRFFVATGLRILNEALGEDNVTLDVASRACKLKLKGGDDAIQHARMLIEEAIAAASDGIVPSPEDNGDGAVCPICYDTTSHPEVLSCGHSCCEPCLRHYLTSAATSNKVPLICMGDEASCNTPISIPIIQRYLTTQRFNHLVDVVFSSYIQSNPRKFKYCTTPDCTQIYQCDTDKQFHKCPSCFSEICSLCNEEAHEGLTCEERRVQSNPVEQERLTEEWARSNSVKRCPSCGVLTEKTHGCNHMTCPCGTHFCWICRGVFDATVIYDHMREAHGGIQGENARRNQHPQPAAPIQQQLNVPNEQLNRQEEVDQVRRELVAPRRRAEGPRPLRDQREAAAAARPRGVAEQEEELQRTLDARRIEQQEQLRQWEDYHRRQAERDAAEAATRQRREEQRRQWQLEQDAVEAARRQQREEQLRRWQVEQDAAEAARLQQQEEEHQRWYAYQETRRRDQQDRERRAAELAREDEKRRYIEAQIAEDVARREEATKQDGSFCTIM